MHSLFHSVTFLADKAGGSAEPQRKLTLRDFDARMLLPEVIFLVLVLCNVYLFLVSWAATRHEGKRGDARKEKDAGAEKESAAGDGAVLLVIAHPDDEAMFFVPTIKSIVGFSDNVAQSNMDVKGIETPPRRGLLYILCLSTGNGDGLGAVRAVEMLASAKSLGVPEEQVRVLDDPALPDGKAEKWAAAVVAKHVQTAVEEWGVSKVLTFDDYGVSGHPNHIDTSRGVLHFLHNSEWGRSCVENEAVSVSRRQYMSEGKLGSATRPSQENHKMHNACKRGGQVYMLESTGLLRKYLGFFDVLMSLLADHGEEDHQCLCSLSPWVNYRAMQAHASQFVWYRRLFIIFSRYTFVNNLNRVSTGAP